MATLEELLAPSAGKQGSTNFNTGDGDNVVIDGQNTRIANHDTPEKPGNTYNDQSLESLLGVVASNAAEDITHSVELTGETDIHGRRLARAYTEDGKDVGTEMIRAGLSQPSVGSGAEDIAALGEARANKAFGIAPTGELASYAEQAANIEERSFLDMGRKAPDYSKTYTPKKGIASTFGDSVARGVDGLQRSLGGLADYVGESLDIDMLRDYGQQVVDRNNAEIMLNPQQVTTFEEVMKDPTKAGTYIIEAFGEMAPSVVSDVLIGLATGGVGALATGAARTAITKEVGKQFARRAAAGSAVSGGTQAVGSLHADLQDAGAEDTGAIPLLGGIATGLVNAVPALKVFERVATDAGLGKEAQRKVIERLSNVGKTAAVGAVAEAPASAAEQLISDIAHITAGTKAADDMNFKDYMESTIRGMVGGGTFGSVAASAGEMINFANQVNAEYHRATGDAAAEQGHTSDQAYNSQDQVDFQSTFQTEKMQEKEAANTAAFEKNHAQSQEVQGSVLDEATQGRVEDLMTLTQEDARPIIEQQLMSVDGKPAAEQKAKVDQLWDILSKSNPALRRADENRQKQRQRDLSDAMEQKEKKRYAADFELAVKDEETGKDRDEYANALRTDNDTALDDKGAYDAYNAVTRIQDIARANPELTGLQRVSPRLLAEVFGLDADKMQTAMAEMGIQRKAGKPEQDAEISLASKAKQPKLDELPPSMKSELKATFDENGRATSETFATMQVMGLSSLGPLSKTEVFARRHSKGKASPKKGMLVVEGRNYPLNGKAVTQIGAQRLGFEANDQTTPEMMVHAFLAGHSELLAQAGEEGIKGSITGVDAWPLDSIIHSHGNTKTTLGQALAYIETEKARRDYGVTSGFNPSKASKEQNKASVEVKRAQQVEYELVKQRIAAVRRNHQAESERTQQASNSKKTKYAQYKESKVAEAQELVNSVVKVGQMTLIAPEKPKPFEAVKRHDQSWIEQQKGKEKAKQQRVIPEGVEVSPAIQAEIAAHNQKFGARKGVAVGEADKSEAYFDAVADIAAILYGDFDHIQRRVGRKHREMDLGASKKDQIAAADISKALHEASMKEAKKAGRKGPANTEMANHARAVKAKVGDTKVTAPLQTAKVDDVLKMKPREALKALGHTDETIAMFFEDEFGRVDPAKFIDQVLEADQFFRDGDAINEIRDKRDTFENNNYFNSVIDEDIDPASLELPDMPFSKEANAARQRVLNRMVRSRGYRERQAKKAAATKKQHQVKSVAFKVLRSLYTRLDAVNPELRKMLFAAPGEIVRDMPFENAREARVADFGGLLERAYSQPKSADRAAAMQADYNELMMNPEAKNALSKVIESVNKQLMARNGTLDLQSLPVAVRLDKLTQNPRGFVAALMEGGVTREDAERAMDHYEQDGMDIGVPKVGVPHTPPAYLSKPKVRQALQSAGFLEQDAPSVVTRYMYTAATRLEWDKKFGRSSGDGKFDSMARFNELTADMLPGSDAHREMMNSVDALLGRYNRKWQSRLKGINSVMLGFNAVRALLFSGVASIPELAYPYFRSQEGRGALKNAMGFMRVIAKTQTRSELVKLARDLNLMNDMVTEHALESLYGMGSLDANRILGRWTRKLFDYNGQALIVKTNQLQSAFIARRMFDDHAGKAAKGDKQSIALLKSFNLSYDQVKRFEADLRDGRSLDIPEHKAYHDAMHRFKQEAVPNPRVSELPLLANDARFQMLIQFKRFMFTLGVRSARIMKHGFQTQGMAYTPAMVAMFAASSALGMLAQMLRELLKSGTTEDELMEDRIIDGFLASGMLGPMQMLADAQKQSGYGNSAAVYLAGPTVGFAFDTLTGDVAKSPFSYVPVVGQLPYMRSPMNQGWRDFWQ